MPKKLKLGVSAAWSSDSSGWGVPSSTVPTDNWGGWADTWGNSSGDIWDSVASEPAAADPPPDWGYDDGWSGPAPDFQAMDLFPSLAANKQGPKRGKGFGSQPQRPKPADFSAVLGTKVSKDRSGDKGMSGRQRNRTDSQDGKSWIQNSVDINKNRSSLEKPISSNNSISQPQSISYLKQATKQPTQSLEDILYTPKQEPAPWGPPPKVVNKPKPQSVKDVSNNPQNTGKPLSVNTDVDSGKHDTNSNVMRPMKPWFLEEPPISTDSIFNSSSNVKSDVSKSPVQEQVVQKSNTVVKPQAEATPVAAKKPIYNQLREQLQKVSSLGKPLVYIIQNGNITVEFAD
ncbi:uncharacterized protein LOC134817889 [Bolinopsis microptera]|uniref:uncharacterized protein LOC134817889 n=1 Tax=Bolinopsis microptera TaxID=2820187 RepID=UPI00307945DF